MDIFTVVALVLMHRCCYVELGSKNNKESKQQRQENISASRDILSANNKFTTSHIPANTEFTASSQGTSSSSTSKGSSTCKGTWTSKDNTKTIYGSQGFKLSAKHLTNSSLW